MGLRIVWLPGAVEDLQKIVNDIDRQTDGRGSIVAARVYETVELLAEFPHMGARIREDETQRHRHLHLHCWNDRVIYLPVQDAVLVVAVVHGARELPHGLLDR